MSLLTDRQIRHLPRRLPVGTVYVVEGRGGQHGDLRVSSRYVVMPSGQKVEFPAEPGATLSAGSGRLIGFHSRPGSRAKKRSTGTKNLRLLPEQGAKSDVEY